MRTAMQETEKPLKPWHMALFAVAILAVGWLIFGAVQSAIPPKITEVRTEESKGNFAPGSSQERRNNEK
ncbi:MAG: hypothetical protein SFU56_04225 [Capsulimonadales bacterium]|nr:hypothetical protein [Capsulimonadales bacterium]